MTGISEGGGGSLGIGLTPGSTVPLGRRVVFDVTLLKNSMVNSMITLPLLEIENQNAKQGETLRSEECTMSAEQSCCT